jgi:hypothetical protein
MGNPPFASDVSLSPNTALAPKTATRHLCYQESIFWFGFSQTLALSLRQHGGVNRELKIKTAEKADGTDGLCAIFALIMILTQPRAFDDSCHTSPDPSQRQVYTGPINRVKIIQWITLI